MRRPLIRNRLAHCAILAAISAQAIGPIGIAASPKSDSALLASGASASSEGAHNAERNVELATIDVAGFRDGAHHWRKIRDDRRVIHVESNQAQWPATQFENIAENILLFQRTNGGWPKDYDMLAVLTPSQVERLRDTRGLHDTSFDNYNIHSQVNYLARAYALGRKEAWREACQRGFDFMLAAQLPSGGFPQRFPDPTGYGAHITFNDGVMIGILNVFKDAEVGATHWKWLDDDRREKARRAVARGVDCILKCQIIVDGKRTGWCQQHLETTFEATSARTFELASICPQESTGIVRFLMRCESPSEQIVDSIEDAVAWLDDATLTGIRVERIAAPVVEFERHRSDFDVIVVDDPKAKPIWARHYEIGTDRPVFAGRDAVKRYSLNEIERERRTGTPWYGFWPQELIEREYPRWKEAQLSGQ